MHTQVASVILIPHKHPAHLPSQEQPRQLGHMLRIFQRTARYLPLHTAQYVPPDIVLCLLAQRRCAIGLRATHAAICPHGAPAIAPPVPLLLPAPLSLLVGVRCVAAHTPPRPPAESACLHRHKTHTTNTQLLTSSFSQLRCLLLHASHMVDGPHA